MQGLAVDTRSSWIFNATCPGIRFLPNSSYIHHTCSCEENHAIARIILFEIILCRNDSFSTENFLSAKFRRIVGKIYFFASLSDFDLFGTKRFPLSKQINRWLMLLFAPLPRGYRGIGPDNTAFRHEKRGNVIQWGELPVNYIQLERHYLPFAQSRDFDRKRRLYEVLEEGLRRDAGQDNAVDTN